MEQLFSLFYCLYCFLDFDSRTNVHLYFFCFMHIQSPVRPAHTTFIPMGDSLSETPAGHGHIAVSLHAGKAVLSTLSSKYPLKLLSPYIHDKTALVYPMTYGGGLVGGDEIDVDVKVQSGARLVLLSQVCSSPYPDTI